MKYFAACFLLLICHVPASACTLTFPSNLYTLAGRVASMELTIKHGVVASIRNTAPGWKYNIDNGASWNTTLDGHALVGAAFLPISDLIDLIHIRTEPHYNCKQLEKPGMLHFIIKLYKNDHLNTIVVDHLTAID